MLTTHTVEVSGARISYDVSPGADAGHRPLFVLGSPMDATGFTTLAGHFTDRTVITYDPRGVARSPRTDAAHQTVPAEHAADIAAVIEAIAAEHGCPVDVFASSGGAINALELVSRRPDLVHTLVAHEPPLAQFLPDRRAIVAACEGIRARYEADGMGPAMAMFIALTMYQGPVPDDFASAPDPAAFGLPSGDDGSRDDPLLGQNVHTCSPHELDVAALRGASTTIVIGVGQESGEQLAARGATALAAQLGSEPVVFPGDHAGFLGGEFGMTGRPDEFAARLRELLDASA